MTLPARWSLGVAALALLATAALVFVGASVSDAAHARREAGTFLARPSPPAPVRTAGAASALPADAEVPGVTRGRRHSSMEALLRPLLVEPPLRAGVFGLDMASGAFFDLSGGQSFSAASLIKIPVAAALLAAVDAGAVSLDESLQMDASDIGGGSGSLQYFPVGSRFTVKRLAELMIRRSDNTATNMLIERLGGNGALNASFAGWGLSCTQLRTPLPDMAGTNTTSPRDLVTVLQRVIGDRWLRPASRELLLSWMRRSHVRSLLPAGVGKGSRVANKTGDIPGALGDAGLVEAPGGRCYLLAVQVERPRNSHRANELIRGVSRQVYQSLTGLRAPQVTARRPSRARASSRRASALAPRRARAS
jgi:beta-lactamase class A